MNRLVDRLPFMLLPAWTRTATQPVALADVVRAALAQSRQAIAHRTGARCSAAFDAGAPGHGHRIQPGEPGIARRQQNQRVGQTRHARKGRQRMQHQRTARHRVVLLGHCRRGASALARARHERPETPPRCRLRRGPAGCR